MLLSLLLALAPVTTLRTTGTQSSKADPILYNVRFTEPEAHRVEVEADVPTGGRASIELAMPVWTPGSYLVREFARNVSSVEARGPQGEPLEIVKISKNRWRVDTGGLPRVRVRYSLYCREMSVRTNFVDESFALLNGAATFLTLVEQREGDGERTILGDRPHRVRLTLPEDWRSAISSMPHLPGDETTFVAEDFHQLVDSPILAGSPSVHRFEVDDVEHLLVHEGDDRLWDGEATSADVRRIVEAQRAFWTLLPYDRFVILNLITEGRGGLEHKDSTVLMTSRWQPRTRKGYLSWLALVSHELFHAWNGKRLRPVELGPFDYEQEVYTRGLWIVEGLTAYYDDLLVHRAGLSTRDEYLRAFSDSIRRLQTTPGRSNQPLASSSFDAWIKLYRRDENSANRGISYYVKGAVVGWLLDIEIRRATDGRRSLDDVLRTAYELYSGDAGYGPGDFRAIAQQIAGTELGPFFEHALDSTDELDYRPALEWLGLRFVADDADEPQTAKDRTGAWLGLVTEAREGRLFVTEVHEGTPGYEAGFNAEDEIVAVDGHRLTPDGWKQALEAYRPGEVVEVLVARRSRLKTIPAKLGEEPEEHWLLAPDPQATEAQEARLAAWLGAPEQAPEEGGAAP